MTAKSKAVLATLKCRAKNKEKYNAYMREYRRRNALRLREFYKKWGKTWYNKTPKSYFSIKRSFRRALEKLAMPSWVDKLALAKIYEDCPTGHEVDHIVPLKGHNVCGLHVPWNLQYLTRLDNRKKANKCLS